MPAKYCPRTTCLLTSRTGRMDLSSFTFSSRTASASSDTGGSIAMSESTCSRWFCTMSRIAPDSS